MQEITLSNGRVVRVCPVPPFALSAVEEKFPLPAEDDSALVTAVLARRERAVRDVAWLCALPDVAVPDDWRFPVALNYAGVEPRPGELGRKIDYIEYELLASTEDVTRVREAMWGVLSEADVAAAEATFPVSG